jgi:PAS domain S-box-containing protein
LFSQQTTDYQIKSGYIYNFTKYFTWEKENKIDTFRIGIYGDDIGFISILKSMENLKAKNKPVRIIQFKSIANITNTHIIIVTNDRNYMVKDVIDLIRGRNTLLITDRCEYQRYVMINFIYNSESKIIFELNSKNLNESGFQINPKLILLGGNEIDVRKLYIETEKSLNTEKEKVETFEKELKQKKAEIETLNIQMNNYNDEIKKLQNNISTQKNELKNIQLLSFEQKKDLENKSKILVIHEKNIENKEKQLKEKNIEISNKQKDITRYGQVLNIQKSEIDKRQSIIKNQEKSLIVLVERMKNQRIMLYMLVAIVLMALALIIIISRNYKINKARNLELEKLSIVARETDNAVIITNHEGIFEWVNEGFTRMFGYKLEQAVQKFGESVVSIPSQQTIQEIFDIINRNKKPTFFESAYYRSDGSKIWVHSNLTPIIDDNGHVKKVIIICSNITALKEAEIHIIEKNEEIQRQSEELFEQTERLTELNEELLTKKNKLEDALIKLKNTQTQLVESEKMIILGQLTAGIAHEINNPVNFINSGIEFLKIAYDQILTLLKKYDDLAHGDIVKNMSTIEEYKNDIDYQTLLSDINQVLIDIKSGVNRTVEIVKSLRTFSRLDEADLKTIDLHKNIESTLVILKNKYSNRIEIDQILDPNIPAIECFPGKINQLLLNILVNAIQAIHDTGKISIITKLKQINNSEIIEIKISDSGSGMTEDVKKKIFEPFFTTKEIGEGTGLGLSISKSIVESHNGTISVDSELNKGTTFTILLPVLFNIKNKTAILED